MLKKLLLFLKQKRGSMIVFFLFFSSFSIAQQKITVNGTVVGENDVPLSGVSVHVAGTTTGITTDAQGKFTLQVNKGATLVLSFVGYEEKQVKVNNGGSVGNIQMVSTASAALGEVVVVGYGKQKKVSVIGAISSISAKEILQSPSSSLATTLAGRLPGLISIQRDGDPGRPNLDIFIRGRSTLNNQTPLILVDGIERDFNLLDPNDIATVSILKDASATAVYGVRGANGVILVTSRRGKAEKTEISFSMDQAGNSFTRYPKTVNAYDYATLLNQALINDGGQAKYTQSDLNHYKNHDEPALYPDNNWSKIFIRNEAPQSRYNLNISGGNTQFKYFVSAGYYSEQGVYRTVYNSAFNYNPAFFNKRYNFRSNIDANISKSLVLTLNTSGYLSKINSPGYSKNVSSIVGDNIHITPANAYNLLDPQGHVLSYPSAVNGPTYGFLNRSGFIQEDLNNINSTFALEQKLSSIVTGLSVKVQYSFDGVTQNTQQRSQSFAQYYANKVQAQNGTDSVTYVPRSSQLQDAPLTSAQLFSYSSHTNLQASINYANNFGKHAITGLILYNQDKKIINIDLPYNLIGIAGRATYNYDEKYFGEVNFGYNGSEQFAKGKRFGFFPSFSAGWLISKEDFFKNIKFVNSFKIRATYGLVGNDRFNAARFLYLDDYQITGSAWPSLGSSVVENLIGNPNVTWETSKKANIGIDAVLFNNLTLTADYFTEKRDNILYQRGTVPILFGSTALPPVNLGKVDNHGFEIDINYNNRVSDNFSYFIKGNLSYARNKIIYLDEPKLPSNYAVLTRATGFQIGQYFGYKVAGYFKDQNDVNNSPSQTSLGGTPQPGDFKYVDVNHDGKINNADIVPIGNSTVPNYTTGFALGFNYKAFDFSVLFQGAFQVSQYVSGQGLYETYNFFTQHLYAWTPERATQGLKIDYPRLSLVNQNNKQTNDFFLDNGAFIRLKNAEIGYTLTNRFTKKIFAKK
ncbi:MAG: SusC/RagA family TonB-linked outer membrane protein [Bacteroidota bacterium]